MNELKKTSKISERLNAIAGALETASIQARMLAEEIGIERTISAADVIAEVNRRAPMFFGTTTHDSPEESGS